MLIKLIERFTLSVEWLSVLYLLSRPKILILNLGVSLWAGLYAHTAQALATMAGIRANPSRGI
jgi:hypothetical protein